MERVVLIGSDISHSLSPRIHNYLFKKYNIPWRYELMPLDPDAVVNAILAMKQGGYRGANVTSPHKHRAIKGVDLISEDARIIGAINTIVIENGRATGHNTDTLGILASLRESSIVRTSFNAAVLGIGGAGAAAAYALLRLPTLQSLTLYSRSAIKAEAEASKWGEKRICGRGLEQFEACDLVIQATPVGLLSSPGTLLTAEQLAGSGLLFEMIYSPAETMLMRAARISGVPSINGERMFMIQALEAFRLWTGIVVDISEVNHEDIFGSDSQ